MSGFAPKKSVHPSISYLRSIVVWHQEQMGKELDKMADKLREELLRANTDIFWPDWSKVPTSFYWVATDADGTVAAMIVEKQLDPTHTTPTAVHDPDLGPHWAADVRTTMPWTVDLTGQDPNAWLSSLRHRPAEPAKS